MTLRFMATGRQSGVGNTSRLGHNRSKTASLRSPMPGRLFSV